MLNNVAALLKKLLQAPSRVVFVIALQLATLPMLDNSVIAMNPTSTITAMPIIWFTSTILFE